MNHNSRSAEFDIEVRNLANKLLRKTLDDDERQRLASILISNTTDSPCVVKAHKDEPIFVLRAQDRFADELVDEWCEKTIASNQEVGAPAVAKIYDARHCAEEMRRWKNRKTPD